MRDAKVSVGFILAGLVLGVAAALAVDLALSQRVVLDVDPIGSSSPYVRCCGGGGGGEPIDGDGTSIPSVRYLRLALSRGNEPVRVDVTLVERSEKAAVDVTYVVEDNGRVVGRQTRSRFERNEEETRRFEWLPRGGGPHSLTVSVKGTNYHSASVDFTAPLIDDGSFARRGPDVPVLIAGGMYGALLLGLTRAVLLARRDHLTPIEVYR